MSEIKKNNKTKELNSEAEELSEKIKELLHPDGINVVLTL